MQKSDQNVRDQLPFHTLWKKIKVAVFVDEEKASKQGSGGDFIGADELIEKYKGNIDFDVALLLHQ